MATRNHKALTEDLEEVLRNLPEAGLVRNRYRTLRMALNKKYTGIISNVSKPVMITFLRDVVYLDRKLRKLTEGKEEELKEELSEEFQLQEGYVPGYHQDIHTEITE